MEVALKQAILSKSPLFDNLLKVELTSLAELFSIRVLGQGEVVFHEGEIGEAMYVIAEGGVDILVRGSEGQLELVEELYAPQFFGEMALIEKECRSATIRVKGDTTLLQLTSDNLHSFAEKYRNGFTWVVVNIARVLSARLREANRKAA